MKQVVERGLRSGVIELIGPAGAGKSTLVSALRTVEPAVASGPSLWGLPTRDLLGALRALLPLFARAALRGRPLAPAEMAQMIRIEAMREAVARARAGGRVLLIDEGPVFGLAWLEVFYANGRDAAKSAWRRRTLAEWSFLLDAVVHLDADDEAIARRIRSRDKSHQVKHAPDDEIRAFTGQFREAFERLLARMAACGGLAVHHLPSSDGAVGDDAVRMRDAIARALQER